MSIMNGASHWCHISKSKSTLQKEWLDKACEWLENNLPITTEEEAKKSRYKVITPANAKVLVDVFRKAMEE